MNKHTVFGNIRVGTIKATKYADVNDIQISGSIKVARDPTKQGNVLTLNKDGSTDWKPIDVDTFFTNKQSRVRDDPNIYYNKGNIGIGVKQSRDLLHVGNSIRVDGVVRTEGIEFLSQHTTLNKQTTFNISTKKENVFQISSKNNIGICHEDPDERLVVNGNVKLTGHIIHKDKQFMFPQQPDILVGVHQPQTLRNKKITESVLVSPKIHRPSISGELSMDGSSTISNVKHPIMMNDVATKGYVDTLLESTTLTYGENVRSILTCMPSADEVAIGRFLISACEEGSDLHDKNACIAEWDGLEWSFQEPVDNNIVFLESTGSRIIYTTDVNRWVTFSTTESSHSNMKDLLHDDHPQYTLHSGREHGQRIIGGTGRGDSLSLVGTSFVDTVHTPGVITLNPSGNGRVGIGTFDPTEALHVDGNIKVTGYIMDSMDRTYELPNQTEENTRLVSEHSIDTLRNKTLVSPIISGHINNLCFKVDTIVKSQSLFDHHVLFILAKDAITLTLPNASLYPGKQYIIRMVKKSSCTVVVSCDNRVDMNNSKHVIQPGSKVTTFISDGVNRWYTM
jgi:hypothetical protein